MERLWTPWRREFVEGAPSGPSAVCFLCVATNTDDDRTALVVYRAEQTFVILNRYPYNSGHVMVAPCTHTGDLAQLDPRVSADLMHTTQRAVAVLERVYHPDAFNVGMNLGRSAGAGVPDHLHVHIVPRWNGDTNFMPVLAETKVLPETLEQTYERVSSAFRVN